MTVAYIYGDTASGTGKQLYEKILGQVMEKGKPEGLVLHLAGEVAGGEWKVLEVWESDEVRERFGQERLFPVFKQHGFDVTSGPPPERIEVKNLIR